MAARRAHRPEAARLGLLAALALVLLWPTGRHRSRKPTPASSRRTAHTAPLRNGEHQRAGDGVAQVGVRRRDLRGA